MKLLEFGIKHFRSIEDINIKFPKNKPLVLFGPNNAGKTNILTSLNIALGESYPTYREMDESDYFFRNKKDYPNIDIYCKFDDVYYSDRYGNATSKICITYNYYNGDNIDNIFHNGNYKKLFVTSEQRAKCQAVYLDAIRNIGNLLSYNSKYTLLSKFSTQVHKSLKEEKKAELNDLFEQIKTLFNDNDKFKSFFYTFKSNIEETVKGFVHTLDIDFSGYDPNNYTKSLRIVGKENGFVRSFEEFGSGEQQTLLMAFVKAYMETFNSEDFILIIEEPEAHLHPIAQRWLKKYIYSMCESGIQVVISTHSPEFIDPNNLQGLVKVYKENGITKVKQLTATELCQKCIELGAPADKINTTNILPFYSACLYSEQLKGLFAQKILLVEGDTEALSLPFYFERAGYNLESNGVEIVKCQGKNNILKYYRFFKIYNYKCFCLFDGDEDKGKKKNQPFIDVFNISSLDLSENGFNIGDEWACFGADFEKYMRSNFSDYDKIERELKDFLDTTSKPIIAKNIARNYNYSPTFIGEIIKKLAE